MEKQIVLRGKIEWVEGQHGAGTWVGFTSQTPVAEIVQSADAHYDIYILDGVRQVYAESLEDAKIGAASTLTDWLNSIAQPEDILTVKETKQ